MILSACASAPTAPGGLPSPTAGPDRPTDAPLRTLPPIQGEASPTPAVLATATRAVQAGPTEAPTSTAAPAKTTAPVKAATPTSPAKPAKPGGGFPDPAGYIWQTVANGFNRPLAVIGDGNGRLLVVEQPGLIWVVEKGITRQEPYLDITARVGSKGNEQGLLGLALNPDYAHNGYLYVNYTDLNGNTVIARFSADPAGATARADSQKILLQVKQPYANHNGGSMVFGPDGYLYMGLGDGGSGGDPQDNGQNVNTFLGKLLRIDVNQGDPYAIPAGNPFQGGGGKPEIWAYGLRNPWRFSFDRATGDLYIGDVGQNLYEEIDFLPKGSKGGANFGWSYREGLHPFKDTPANAPAMIDPIFEYQHPVGCSVSGGYVYRGAALPEFQGIYLFGDYCNGKIWGLLRAADGSWQNKLLFQSGFFISSFGEDDQGELLLIDQQSGAVLRLIKKDG